MTTENIVALAPSTPTLSIEDFMSRTRTFLDGRCAPGMGQAVSRAEVVKAGGLSPDNDALISDLINAGFMPGWKIRQGRDGGVCRVGEEVPKGPNPKKYTEEFMTTLMSVLNTHVPTSSKIPVTRNVIARELAKITGEDVLALPNKISEAISLGKCPGFESKRGSGIFRKESPKNAEALAVSSEAAVEVSVADVVAENNVTTETVADETSVETVEVSATEAPVETVSEPTTELAVVESTVVEPVVQTSVEVSGDVAVETAESFDSSEVVEVPVITDVTATDLPVVEAPKGKGRKGSRK